MAVPLPRVDATAVSTELNNYNRQPFLDILSRAISSAPRTTSLRKFSNKAPDRYAQYVAVFARLAGFSDKIEVTKNIHHWIHEASDAELRRRIAAIEAQLNSIDVTPAQTELIEDNSAT